MANREVNLTKRVTTPNGMRYCPVVLSANGRVKPDYVLVDGKPERHTEGAYYLEWRDGSKRIRLSMGKDANVAQTRRSRKEAELNAINNGVTVESDGADPDKHTLKRAITSYLEEIELTHKPATLAAYSTALAYFAESCAKSFVENIERKDMLQFTAFLRDQKHQSPRSCWNKFSNVMSFLKAQGIRGIVGKNDWPRFVEEEPEVYERDVLDVFFAACDDEERLWFEFFQMTGMREQEVMYCAWPDINFHHATISVKWKPEYNWEPKAYKEREIPVPEKLIAALKVHKTKSDKTCSLIFPTSGCNPKLNFLDCCKAVAQRAGLNKDEFWLHKFRATFATWHLWAGVDLRTVQKWLGHTDMESTMRYLKPARNQAVRDKVNITFA